MSGRGGQPIGGPNRGEIWLADLGAGRLPAYGEVLAGVLDGDPLLSVRGDTAEQCWRVVDPVLEAWRAGETALDSYPAGSDGPTGWS